MKNLEITPQFEFHIMQDNLLPFIFHKDEICTNVFYPNWHSNIEILHCISGSGQIKCDAKTYDFNPGDIFVVNSELVHSVRSSDKVIFRCLIIDNDFCASNGIPTSSLRFQEKINDLRVNAAFLNFVNEYNSKTQHNPLCRNAAIRGAALNLLIELCEKYVIETNVTADKKDPSTKRIRDVLLFVRQNFSSDLTLDALAKYAGINKYYLSREFKRLTGQTLFEYINIVRCNEAKRMINDGMSVSSAAISCGFDNLSYFSRTYKKYIGTLPSQH